MSIEPRTQSGLEPLTDGQRIRILPTLAISRAALWALHEEDMISRPDPGNERQEHAYALYVEAVAVTDI
jgi:hypothetical protein